MPKNPEIKRVLVIGSDPIIIGQAAEFDYAGTQACRTLCEGGIKVVLLDSNPATIMTDKGIADHVYIESLIIEVLEHLILKEKLDSVLPTLSGQAGLNLVTELEEGGFFAEYNVRLIGTTALTIKKAEDRELFRETMGKIGEPVTVSKVIKNVEDGIAFAERIGYPVVLRPAYTFGGNGGGTTEDHHALVEILQNDLRLSRVRQVLVKHCIAGWKEVKYEVTRDDAGDVITICNIENLDPVGVRTGDSIVVAPSQTLGDKGHQMFRSSTLSVITELDITGGYNAQYTLNPSDFEHCVIEVNPRVNRSSALVSKATDYPIAEVAAEIVLGYTLDGIKNAMTRKTYASFEPTLDYCMVKMPRLPFDKFITAKHTLDTQMKATGEVMAICTNFEGALIETVYSLEQRVDSLMSYDYTTLGDDKLQREFHVVDDRRIWVIAEALRRGFSYGEISAETKIDRRFIHKLDRLVRMEAELRRRPLIEELLREVKRFEFPDHVITAFSGKIEAEVKEERDEFGVHPGFRVVDTCAAELAAETPYYYSVYDGENKAEGTKPREKVLVLDSGPIRIGRGTKFDFCSVYCTFTFRKEGYETIIIDNNPKAVSTDFDIAGKLYFEPLTPEDIEVIVNFEKPDGAVVQFGGQTVVKLTEALMKVGVPILGTATVDVGTAEDREFFDEILQQTGISRTMDGTVFTAEEAKEIAHHLGYPVLVHPSYVLGDADMRIVISDHNINEYIGVIDRYAQEYPILVDKYIQGIKIEADAVYDGKDIPIPGIMQHIERTDIHSGDSISVYPAQSLSKTVKERIVDYSEKLAHTLYVKGMINIQFIAKGDDVYVIEVNPRSSRAVPYISEVTGTPITPLATRVICGYTIRRFGYEPGPQKGADHIVAKMPVFSSEKIRGIGISLEPEMKSTSECLGIAKVFNEALYKAFQGVGVKLPKYENMVTIVRDEDKMEIASIAKRFKALSYHVFSTRDTAGVLREAGIKTLEVRELEQGHPNILDLILGHEMDLVTDTPPEGANHEKDGFEIRKSIVETGVNVLIVLDTAEALATVFEQKAEELTLIDIATL